MGSKLRIMIIQPTTICKSTEQIEKERKQLVEELESQGYEVVNTIFAEESSKDCDTAIFYLAKTIEAISKVDIVYFMEGWRESRACIIEDKICQVYSKTTMYQIYKKRE